MIFGLSRLIISLWALSGGMFAVSGHGVALPVCTRSINPNPKNAAMPLPISRSETTINAQCISFADRRIQPGQSGSSAGLGPRIAPRSDSVPCYAEAPIGQQVEIGAYIGLPLKGKKGELFGTLCAIDPQPQPEHIVEELPQIEVLAKLLEAVLASEQRANEEARRADRAGRWRSAESS